MASLTLRHQVRVAIIREEGSNGDREMGSAIYAAGMEPWDVTMSDLLQGRASLDSFQGALVDGGGCGAWATVASRAAALPGDEPSLCACTVCLA